MSQTETQIRPYDRSGATQRVATSTDGEAEHTTVQRSVESRHSLLAVFHVVSLRRDYSDNALIARRTRFEGSPARAAASSVVILLRRVRRAAPTVNGSALTSSDSNAGEGVLAPAVGPGVGPGGFALTIRSAKTLAATTPKAVESPSTRRAGSSAPANASARRSESVRAVSRAASCTRLT